LLNVQRRVRPDATTRYAPALKEFEQSELQRHFIVKYVDRSCFRHPSEICEAFDWKGTML